MIVQIVQMLHMLQRHQYDISYHEDIGKNNRQKTDGGDNHRRRAVRFHAGQRDN